MAWTYDLVANLVSLGHWWEWQQQALPYLPAQGKILELGHGTGHMLEILAQRGNQALGVDLSPAMGRIAQAYLRQKGIDGLACVRASGLSLPFASESFAAVLTTFPTEYIFEPATLHEIRRILSPDGCLVIVLGASIKPGNAWRTFWRWVWRITGETSEGVPSAFRAQFHRRLAEQGFVGKELTLSLPHSSVWLWVVQAVG